MKSGWSVFLEPESQQSIAQWFFPCFEVSPGSSPTNRNLQISLASAKSAPAGRSFSCNRTRYLKQSLASVVRPRSYAVCLFIALIGASFTGPVHTSDYTLTFPNYILINGPDSPVDA